MKARILLKLDAIFLLIAIVFLDNRKVICYKKFSFVNFL